MLNFENFRYDYKPFPIGVAHPFIDPSLYGALAESYPDANAFPPFRAKVGGPTTKYSLSARSAPRQLARFLDANPPWRAFYEYLYGIEFTEALLAHLESRGLQLIKRRSKGLLRWINLAAPRLARSGIPGAERIAYTLPRKLGGISSKLEFSAIPANDGGVRPHTDSPGKLVTLVLAFPREHEWDATYGGGTSIVEPRDERQYFNRLNQSLPFEAVDVRRVVEHQPNQAMLFVKTFNSWHAVMPTHGPPGVWRKTLTVNVMAD